MSTAYHARYFANELTRKRPAADVDRLSMSLFNASVDLNPHQIDAAMFALKSPLSKGVILADEVGLGKTIEAGLVLCQCWAERRRRLLVICPASLRKQWSLELEEKFNLPTLILDAATYKQLQREGTPHPFLIDKIVITSIHFASTMQSDVRPVSWDLVVIDEAHKLRNAYRTSNRMGQMLRETLLDRRKLLLTATPLQNSLLELYGLSTIVDGRIFGEVASFRSQYMNQEADLEELRGRLQYFCKRTLRKQVIEYIQYTERRAFTAPFRPGDEEQRLYDAVSEFLLRDDTYSIPSRQRVMTTLILRKLLASSSYAIAGTLDTLKSRLLKLRDGLPPEEDVAEQLVLIEEMEEDYLEESAEATTGEEGKKQDPPKPTLDRKKLEAEIGELERFSSWARGIGTDTKSRALIKALEVGFSEMAKMGARRKALIFTESRRTQQYLKTFLETNGYAGQIVLFSGSNSDAESQVIYQRWLQANQATGRATGSKAIDIRTALIEHFRDQATLMIATEAGAEGINLQFCSVVINYDLPWNPQRIEQRIGRCHRYGQKHDVVVINFLNELNAADRRVLELLAEKFSLFSGVFGASDEVLGTIESGVDFEKRILEIYQQCRSTDEIDAAFKKLREELDATIQARIEATRRALLEHFDEDVHARLRVQLDAAREQLDRVGRLFWSLNNLVLVDEGHRGTSAGEEGAWMRFRNALCEDGFSFEYSATFGQAIKANRALTDLYAKNILFDYSYRYFYGDGFGKDYQILNLDEGTQANHLELYLVACLLAFFQQLRLYRELEAVFRPFNIEKPLWIFVGGSVTKTLATRDASDIIEILRFVARYVSDRVGSIERIERVLNQGLVTADGKNLFTGRFTYLNTAGLTATQVFEETLVSLFNAPGGGLLHVENLKGATGEIALRVGDMNEPFGVINVGDDAKLVKLCEENGLQTGERQFSGSLFHEINKPHSTVNVLIGSKKFTEGWNSWRVSTMGLMNVGQTEGSQIIQLFGRGVRLKGYDLSLKRSGKTHLTEDVMPPKHIGLLETLNIFGIRADYMAQSRDFLEEEGLPTNDDQIEFLLPVIKNLGTQKLKIIQLKKTINGVSTEFDDGFRKLGPVPTLAKPDPLKDKATAYLQKNQVVLNWYPKIQAMKSHGVLGGDADAAPNQTHLTASHVTFLGIDQLYFELERFKAERGWYNLNLTRDGITSLLADQSWYQLLIPPEELDFDSFEKTHLWQEIALALLKKYTERYYTFRKREWELPHLEYQDLSEDDPNFLGVKDETSNGYYRILIERSQDEIAAKLAELKALIEKGDLKLWEFHGLKAIWFGRHLYEPLLYLDQKIVEISPVPLNKGERQFVEDLKVFHDNDGEFFAEKQLYLLRNLSKGRGVGFFEAGNFHPDFILWLLIGSGQHVIFVDPKGIRNLGPTDPKIQFYTTIKEIEQRLGDTGVHLHSFIVSNTPSHTMRMFWGMDKPSMTERHILFQEEDKESYVGTMLQAVIVSQSVSEP